MNAQEPKPVTKFPGPWRRLDNDAQGGAVCIAINPTPCIVVIDLAVGPPADERILAKEIVMSKDSAYMLHLHVNPGEEISYRVVASESGDLVEVTGCVIGSSPAADSNQASGTKRAAIEDSSLTPAQRRHWDEMEKKQAAKEQLKKDAEDRALQEKAKQLSDAGNAMDRVRQDHGHKLGWR